MANSKKRCRHCKEYFPVAQGVKVPLGFFCSYDHATAHGLEKAQKARSKQNKKELTEYRERTKNVSQWKREAQTAFNAYIRFRDTTYGCISCGNNPERKLGGTMDAGHYRSRGAAQHLAFHLHNCHAQCVRCNQYLSGNIVEYRKGLIDRIGLDKVEALENNNDIRRFDIEYYKRIKSIFTRKLRIKKKLIK
jgi:hypothetical protein